MRVGDIQKCTNSRDYMLLDVALGVEEFAIKVGRSFAYRRKACIGMEDVSAICVVLAVDT